MKYQMIRQYTLFLFGWILCFLIFAFCVPTAATCKVGNKKLLAIELIGYRFMYL